MSAPSSRLPRSSFLRGAFLPSRCRSFLFFFSSFVPMRNTRDVHGRVLRLCRLYFTLCPVRKRIISSLILGERGEGALFLFSPSVHSLCSCLPVSFSPGGRTRDQTSERKRERERERWEQRRDQGGRQGEREVSGGYASLFTGAAFVPYYPM